LRGAMFSPLIDKSKLQRKSDPSPTLAPPVSRTAAARGAPPVIQAQAGLLNPKALSTNAPPAPVVARILAWSDFRVVPDRIDGHSAQTGYGYRGTPNGFTIVFNPATSWSVVADQTDALLRHEQYHLKLAAMLATKANIASAGGMSDDAVTAALKAALTQYEGNYESDTNNGLNTDAQAQWESDIDTSVPVFPLP
jgi:hypothetical protein